MGAMFLERVIDILLFYFGCNASSTLFLGPFKAIHFHQYSFGCNVFRTSDRHITVLFWVQCFQYPFPGAFQANSFSLVCLVYCFILGAMLLVFFWMQYVQNNLRYVQKCRQRVTMLLHDRHHRVSLTIKVHHNTHNSFII